MEDWEEDYERVKKCLEAADKFPKGPDARLYCLVEALWWSSPERGKYLAKLRKKNTVSEKHP